MKWRHFILLRFMYFTYVQISVGRFHRNFWEIGIRKLTLSVPLFKHKKEAITILYVQIYMRKLHSNFC